MDVAIKPIPATTQPTTNKKGAGGRGEAFRYIYSVYIYIYEYIYIYIGVGVSSRRRAIVVSLKAVDLRVIFAEETKKNLSPSDNTPNIDSYHGNTPQNLSVEPPYIHFAKPQLCLDRTHPTPTCLPSKKRPHKTKNKHRTRTNMKETNRIKQK